MFRDVVGILNISKNQDTTPPLMEDMMHMIASTKTIMEGVDVEEGNQREDTEWTYPQDLRKMMRW
jgi:hypothetical protein